MFRSYVFRFTVSAGALASLLLFQNCSAPFRALTGAADASSSSVGNLKHGTFSLQSAADWSVTKNVFGSPLTITTGTRTAGAISSITWRGKEFIDAYDHGRELQSAAFFSMDECWNPTEAGSGPDRTGPTSTSQLLGISTDNNVLQTTVRMAYWEPCGHQPLSNDRVSKVVTIGYAGMENVIDYRVAFDVAESHDFAMFEALTSYMPGEFNQRFTYDPVHDQLAFTDVQGEQGIPVILATADANFAMGFYTADLPQQPNLGYGSFGFGDTTKFNAVYRPGSVSGGSRYEYEVFVIVGTVSDVVERMRALYARFQGQPNSPAVAQTPVVTTPTALIDNGRVINLVTFNGRCLDVQGASFDANAPVWQYDCNGTGAQTFRALFNGDGSYTFQNTNSGMCVDIPGASFDNFVSLQQYPCNGTGAQRFNVQSKDGGFRMVNTNSGKCVDVRDYGQSNGTVIQQVDCQDNDAAQIFGVR